MKIGYYPGCSLAGTAKEFDKSFHETAAVLGEKVNEINDWSCCGASSAHAFNHLLSVALPARNLSLAEEQGYESIMAPCAACYNRLIVAQNEIKTNNHTKEKVEEIIEHKFENKLEVINILQYYANIGLDNIKSKVKKDLSDLNIACYYGCLLVRPNAITGFDDAEQPKSMDELVSALGAKAIDWNYKVECCGASHSIAHVNVVEDLTKKLLDDAKKHGADAVVVACPMCHSNLDMRQRNIIKHNSGFKEIPIFYISQLIGLAMGVSEDKLGLDLHFIDTKQVVKKKVKEASK